MPDDTVTGTGPARPTDAAPSVPVARPASLAEARQAVLDARDGLLVRGGGTGPDWGAPVHGVGLVLDTTALDRLVAHNPADMTVAVGAGMRLSELQRQLAPAGQWLALDPPTGPHGATLGGLLATGDAGPHRLAHGALRDLVIGITVVLADGAVARAGGHVIKNVAGYDLAKLFAGSLGAFGLVTELVLRVHPLPPAGVTLAVPADEHTALAATRELRASPLEPVAAEWDGRRLLVRFEGTPGALAERERQARALPALRAADRLDGDTGQHAWDALAAAAYGGDGDTVVRAGARPDRLPDLARSLRDAAEGAGVGVELTSSVALGVHTARIHGGDAAGHAACVRTWRDAVHAAGGTAVLRRRRDGVDMLVPAWGAAPPTAPLLRALKQRFDPDGRFAPGRFTPWF